MKAPPILSPGPDFRSSARTTENDSPTTTASASKRIMMHSFGIATTGPVPARHRARVKQKPLGTSSFRTRHGRGDSFPMRFRSPVVQSLQTFRAGSLFDGCWRIESPVLVYELGRANSTPTDFRHESQPGLFN